MKKRILCTLLILALICSVLTFAVSCKPTEPEVPPIVSDDETVSKTMEKPADSSPSTVSAKESLYIAAGELQRAGGFKGVTAGSSTAVGIAQNIASERTVVGNNVFKQSVSYSAFVKSGEQLYVFGDNFLSRASTKVKSMVNVTWDNTAKKYTPEAYKEKMGYVPNGLTGYILNDTTILDAKLEKTENGLYTFRYVLDTQKAPYLLQYEMRNNANSKKFPVFTKAELVITMDANFIVQTLTTDCEYKASSGGLSNIPCKESITEVFSDIGYKGNLPEKEFFEQFFDASAITDIGPKETTALDVLTGMFNTYLTEGETLNANIAISSGTTKVTNALVRLNMDIDNLANLTANVKIGNGVFATYQDSKLYLDFQSFKGSTTIDGVKDFVASLNPATADEMDKKFNSEEIFDNMTFVVKNGVCRVTMNIAIDDNTTAIINFNGTAADEVYTFTNADATIGDVKLKITIAEGWDVPELSGEYPEILGLTNLLQNGAITLQANLDEVEAKVMYDVAENSLYVQSNVLDAAYTEGVVYAQVGDAKLKFETDTLDQLKDILSVFQKESSDTSISLQDILKIVGDITATATDNGVVLTAQAEDLKLTVQATLVANQDGWWLDGIEVRYDKISAQLVPSEKFVAPQIGDKSEYVDITDVAARFVPALYALSTTETYQSNFSAAVTIDENSYEASGSLLLEKDGAICVDAIVCKNGEQVLTANVVYAQNTVYITANDIKYAFTIEASDENPDDTVELPEDLDISQYIPEIDFEGEIIGAIAEKITAIVEAFQNKELSVFDLISLIGNASFQNHTLILVVDGTVLDLDSFTIMAKAGLKSVEISIDGLQIAGITANANATLAPTDDAVIVPDIANYETDITTILEGLVNANNYKLQLDGTIAVGDDIFGLNIGVLYNNGDVFASAIISLNNVNAISANVWYADSTVYAQLNGLNIALAISQPVVALDDADDEQPTLAETLQPLYGYNTHLDSLLDLILNIAEKAQNEEIDYAALISKIVISDDGIAAELDGTQLGISNCTVAFGKITDGLSITLSNLGYQDMEANLTIAARITSEVVEVPDNDWSTNVCVALDDHNSISASLDFINGLYNFKLENDLSTEEIYVLYDATLSTFKVKKGDDIKITGDIGEISSIVEYISQLVKDFAGGETETYVETADITSLLNIDIEALLADLTVELCADAEQNTVRFAISTLGYTASAVVANNGETVFDNISVVISEALSVVATPCNKFDCPDFDEEDYIALDVVLGDYLDTIEVLVNTNCWQFTFDADSQIDITDENDGVSSYQIAQGSYVKFYFNMSNPDDFMLRAYADINYYENGAWTDLATLDIAYIDGRIFITYNTKLKMTISTEAISNCTSLFDELKQAIPQIGEMLDQMNEAKDEAENNVSEIDYTAIIHSVSYQEENNLFTLVLNGSALLADLGDITLAVSKTDETITLEQLLLNYSNISITLNGITVSASALAEDEADEEIEEVEEVEEIATIDETDDEEPSDEVADYEQYAVAKEILSYFDDNGAAETFMNFDSVREMLRALIDTAQNHTFAIDGVVTANINLLIVKANIPLDMSVRIDIDEDDNIYVAAKVTHQYAKTLGIEFFADKGGTGYLYFNGATGEFTVLRDSYYNDVAIVTETYKYCTKCEAEASWKCTFHSKYIETREREVEKTLDTVSLKENDYYAKLTSEEFMETMMDQIFEMLHLSSTLESPIRDAIKGDNSGEGEGGEATQDELTLQKLISQLQDILLGYKYVAPTEEADGYFQIDASLKPINNSLQNLTLKIGHTVSYTEQQIENEMGELTTTTTEKFSLTYLRGEFTIASVVHLNFDFSLQQQPIEGEGKNIVLDETHWNA